MSDYNQGDLLKIWVLKNEAILFSVGEKSLDGNAAKINIRKMSKINHKRNNGSLDEEFEKKEREREKRRQQRERDDKKNRRKRKDEEYDDEEFHYDDEIFGDPYFF